MLRDRTDAGFNAIGAAAPGTCSKEQIAASGSAHGDERTCTPSLEMTRMTRSGHAATQRLPPGARSSVMSAAIFETGSKATTTAVASAVPRVFAFPYKRSTQSSLIQKVLAASTRRTA